MLLGVSQIFVYKFACARLREQRDVSKMSEVPHLVNSHQSTLKNSYEQSKWLVSYFANKSLIMEERVCGVRVVSILLLCPLSLLIIQVRLWMSRVEGSKEAEPRSEDTEQNGVWAMTPC